MVSLVTGGAGFIGAHVTNELIQLGHKVIVLDDLSGGFEDHVNENAIFVKGSVIDLVVGSGDRNYKIPVPVLIGHSREEAIREINMASFNLGSEFYMDSIIDSNLIFMQEPRNDLTLNGSN